MIVRFFKDRSNETVEFECDNMILGGDDGGELRAVTHGIMSNGNACINKSLIAKKSTVGLSSDDYRIFWLVVGKGLLWREGYYSGFEVCESAIAEVIDNDTIQSEHEAHMFEIGWERGYSQGYDVGMIKGADRALNILSGERK